MDLLELVELVEADLVELVKQIELSATGGTGGTGATSWNKVEFSVCDLRSIKYHSGTGGTKCNWLY